MEALEWANVTRRASMEGGSVVHRGGVNAIDAGVEALTLAKVTGIVEAWTWSGSCAWRGGGWLGDDVSDGRGSSAGRRQREERSMEEFFC